MRILIGHEWFATSQKWDEGDWAVSLSLLLKGKRLQVYTSMPPDDANNYGKLKTALLQWYKLTEDRFHWKFRENQPEVVKQVFQFVAQLRSILRDGLIWESVMKALMDYPTYSYMNSFSIHVQQKWSCSARESTTISGRNGETG